MPPVTSGGCISLGWRGESPGWWRVQLCSVCVSYGSRTFTVMASQRQAKQLAAAGSGAIRRVDDFLGC